MDVAGEMYECESSDDEYLVEDGDDKIGEGMGFEDGKNRDEVDR